MSRRPIVTVRILVHVSSTTSRSSFMKHHFRSTQRMTPKQNTTWPLRAWTQRTCSPSNERSFSPVTSLTKGIQYVCKCTHMYMYMYAFCNCMYMYMLTLLIEAPNGMFHKHYSTGRLVAFYGKFVSYSIHKISNAYKVITTIFVNVYSWWYHSNDFFYSTI